MDETPLKNLNIVGFEEVHHELTVPQQIDKHIEFVEVSSNGDLLVGASNLNGCYWTGSIWYFLESGSKHEKDKTFSGLKCKSGICDGKFLSDSEVIIGEDLGVVSIMGLEKSNHHHQSNKEYKFNCLASRSEHDHAVLSVSVAADKTKAVTGSMDKCIKVWSISSDKSLMSEHTYRPAHKDHVTCVAMNKMYPNGHIFASCSLDGAVVVWDTRLSKPAQVIYEDIAIGFTSLAWINESELVVGSTMGDISCIDTGSRNLLSKTNISYPRPIHRVVVNNNLVAVCSDDTCIRVVDINNKGSGDKSEWSVVYSDTEHKDYVRGLAWMNDSKFVSCGWDKQVLIHHLNKVDP